MSQIRFVSQLGDAFDLAIAAERPARSFARLRVPRGRSRLVAVLAVLALSGGIATAATLLSQRATTLVARGLACENSTPTKATSQYFDIEQYGRTPLQACAATMHVPVASLLACTSGRFGVVVVERRGDVDDECRSGGLTNGLPPGYAVATARVSRLQHDLNRLYASRDCFTVHELEAATQADLDRLGFVGWRTRLMTLPRGLPSAGPCAQYPGTGSSWSDAAAALDGPDRVVMVDTGAYRQIARLRGSAGYHLTVASGKHCYSLPSIQRYVTDTIRRSDTTSLIKFAAYAAPRGTGLALGRQPRYNAGCAVVVNVSTAPDGRTFLVELWQRGRPPIPDNKLAGGVVTTGAYQPVLGSS